MPGSTASLTLRRWTTLAALILASLSSLLVARDARAAQVGAVADITWGQPRSAVDREIAALEGAGVRWIRANVNWAGLEAEGKGRIGVGQLAEYDYAIDRARAAGLEVLMPISDGVPYWASGDPRKYVDAAGGKHWNRLWPPANMADYGDIVSYVVDRYRAKGVHTYEIWNEPNLFWASGPDPAAYVPMLKAGYRAVKAADPGATVLLGGLSKADFKYLGGVYAAGGGPYFDAVAVHPYTYGVDPTVSWNGVNAGEDPARLSWNSFPAIQEVKRTMDAHGDSHKQVWITEFGYSTTTADGGVSEATQAAFLTKAYTYVERFPWVHSMFWYAARNDPYTADRDHYGARFGLMRTDFTPKPSLAAMQSYALSQPATNPTAPVGTDAPAPDGPVAPAPAPVVTSPAPPTGDALTPPANRAPSVRLTAPTDGSVFGTRLAFSAEAADDTRVVKVEFVVDGKVVATDSTAPYAATWRVPRRLDFGQHAVSARAYDDGGLTAVSSVAVTRGRTDALATPLATPLVTLIGAKATKARTGQTASGRRTVAVSGRAPRGRARAWLRFERFTGSRRWVARHTRRVDLRLGHYRRTIQPAQGRWRVRLVVATTSKPTASSYRTFVR